MSKGLSNGCDFNINCKICNSKNISAYETDGYIYLTCNECKKNKIKEEKIETLKNDKNPDNTFIKKLLTNNDAKEFKNMLTEILIKNTEKATEVTKEISKILADDFDKKGKDGGFVDKDSVFKEDIFKLCNELKGLVVVDYAYIEKSYKTFTIQILGDPVYDENCKMYELEMFSYDLDLEVRDNKYNLKINYTSDVANDTILLSGESECCAENYETSVLKLKKFVNKI